MQTPKVLLVNDDQASLYALESLLLDAADQHLYELITAGSGKEALRHVLRHEFAVILMDVSMPGMDGFETAEAIHSHPRSAGTPIIFITAHYADELNRLKGYQKGAADYLFTPVIPQILQAKVAVFVEMAKKNMQLRIKTEELARLNQDLRVHELSTRDALTNLLNRRALIQQLEHAVATSDRSGIGFALLFLDLDKFNPINDTCGHEAGDELLRQVAARLTAAVRVADIVARLGGDEFVVLIEGKSASANAARVGRKIETACALPFDIGGHRVKTAASIGIALYPQDGANAQALMKNADTAMYHAKQNAATPVQFFHEELNVRERERERWTLELRKALAAGQLELRYEPQVDLDTGRMVAAEALLYWRHPVHGTMEAAQFLPLVQKRTLLDRIDAWVMAQCCSQAALWQGLHGAVHGAPPLCIWLNLATPQLHPDLLQALLPSMRKHGLAAGGTDIVAAVIHLARALAMQVVALGVETRQQLEVLQELGCHTCQGALFYPPLPAAVLLEQASGDFNTHPLPSNEEHQP